MNAHSLLSELTARGAVVSAAGDRLRLQAAGGVVWDDLRPAIQTLKPELLALLQSDPLTPDAIPPADGLQRRGAFIMPTRETLPAYRAHFDAKAGSPNGEPDPQTELLELPMAKVKAAKREKSLTSAATRPAREFYPADVYEPEKGKKGDC